MTGDTDKPSSTTPAAPATNTGTAADTKQKAAKPAMTRRTARTAKAAPATKRPATASLAKADQSRNGKRGEAAAKPAPAKQPARMTTPAAIKKADQTVKAKKVKLVRDSFTMPETEYAVIAELKKRCLKAGVSAKKSEILRAAVAGLVKLSDSAVVTAIRRLEVVKTGRPAKAKDSK